MDKTVYICTGTCKAEISEEQFNEGLKKCGTPGCNMRGHTFAKRLKCHECKAYYKPGDNHSHLV